MKDTNHKLPSALVLGLEPWNHAHAFVDMKSLLIHERNGFTLIWPFENQSSLWRGLNE